MTITSSTAKELAEFKAAVHQLFNVTTNPPEVEARLRAMLYGTPLAEAVNADSRQVSH